MANDTLYIVKRTFVDLKNPAEISFNVALPATFTNLKAAKDEAKAVLFNEGYEKSFFPVYDVNDGKHEWSHGDGMIVCAEGPSHESFEVEINTVPNTAKFEPDDDGRVRRPLHHVLQTDIHYGQDSSGSVRDTIVESVHAIRELALAQAMKVLLDESIKKKDFVEYDEYTDGTEGPFGPDVVVHAVKDGGENVLVSVISNFSI